jgi:hypothetical protein
MPSSNVQRLINRALYENYTCVCVQNKVLNVQSANNNPQQTTVERISQQLQLPLGGRISFGIAGVQTPLNYLGTRDGQPGGSGAPPRNRF